MLLPTMPCCPRLLRTALILSQPARHLATQHRMSRSIAATLLSVDVSASTEEIKRAYRAAVLTSHPDTQTGSHEAWLRLREAFDVMCEGSISKRAPGWTVGEGGTGHSQPVAPSAWEREFIRAVQDLQVPGAQAAWAAAAARSLPVQHATWTAFLRLCFITTNGVQAAVAVARKLAQAGQFVAGASSFTSPTASTSSSPASTATEQRSAQGRVLRGRAGRTAGLPHRAAPPDPWGGASAAPAAVPPAACPEAERASSSAEVRAWRGGFSDGSAPASHAYNELLRIAGELQDMDSILAAVSDMYDLGLQPDLALCERELFTFFPKAHASDMLAELRAAQAEFWRAQQAVREPGTRQ